MRLIAIAAVGAMQDEITRLKEGRWLTDFVSQSKLEIPIHYMYFLTGDWNLLEFTSSTHEAGTDSSLTSSHQ